MRAGDSRYISGMSKRSCTLRTIGRVGIISNALLLLMWIGGCQDLEPLIGNPIPPIKNPFSESDPIEKRIAALRTVHGGDWYTWSDYFSPPDYFRFGSPPPVPVEQSATAARLKPLIALGPAALPHLIVHLSDAHKTGFTVEHHGDMGGMLWEGQYDSRPGELPEELGDQEDKITRQRHTVTVGDLCFYAIGQIVNRDFDPVKPVPTLCIAINSPTSIPALAARVAKDWSGLTPEAHRDSLLRDFRAGREGSAMLRLGFYYPTVAEPIALDELRRPIYSRSFVENFASTSLYSTTDPRLWDQRYAAFVAQNGQPFRDGLVAQLLSDSEEYQPGKWRERNAPKILARLFPDMTRAALRDGVQARAAGDQADLVQGLSSLRSEEVDAEVYRIFHGLSSGEPNRYDEETLASACMERLMHKGHDDEFVAYCIAHVRPTYGKDDGFLMKLRDFKAK